MKVLFVTVGTTAIYNPGIGTVDGRDNAALLSEAQNYERDPFKLARAYAPMRDRLIQEHLRYWGKGAGYVAEPDNFHQSAAELTSTWTLLHPEEKGVKPQVNRMVLLTTPTPEGQLAGEIVLIVMRSDDYDVGFPKVSIDKVNVPGLETEFNTMQTNLLAAINANRISPLVPALCNVTGGYKATAILVARHAKRERLRLFYQHETQNKGLYLNEKDESGDTSRIVWDN